MQTTVAALVLALAACGSAQKFKTDDGSMTMMVEDGKSIKMQIGNMEIDPSTIPADIETAKQESMMYTAKVNESLYTTLHDWAGDIEDDLENATNVLGGEIEKVMTDLLAYADIDDEKQRTSDAIGTAVDALGVDDLKSTVRGTQDNVTKTQAWQEAHKKCLAQKMDMRADGTCINKNFLIPSRHWGDVRRNGCWETVRSWEAQKLNPASWLQLQYTDTLGFYSQSRQHTTACRWRILIDGKTYREHYTHSQNNMPGWHIFPTTLTNYYSPTDFKHQWFQTHLQNHKFEIQACRNGGSGQCLQGWPTNNNGASVITREVDPSLVSVARYMDDKRMRGTGFTTIPGRVVAHTVAEDKSVLIVTYSDTMGRYEYGRNNVDTCGVRLIMTGNGATKTYVEHRTAGGSRGTWYLFPGSIRWVIPAKDIGKGKKLTFTVQARRFSSGASECAYGWSNRNVHNTLAVEEITETRQKTLTIKSTGMKPFTSTSGSWRDITGRALTVNKQSADSVLVVSYSDIFGYSQRYQSTACRFRVLFSNNRRDTQEKYSHAGGGYGYRYYNFHTQWTCTTCPKGSLAVKIQVLKSGAANNCVLGKSVNDQGVITVEEVSAP